MRGFELIAGAKEKLTVSSTALGVSAAVLKPTTGIFANQQAKALLIDVESNSIRFYLDGSTPTTTDGHPLHAGDSRFISGIDNINKLRMIRISADATLQITAFF
jgi:hypothetical protein